MDNNAEKSVNSVQAPIEIYKQEDFDLMLEMIKSGIWKNVNLSRALHIDEDTIAKWKKHQDAIDAHRQAILKFIKRRTDVEKILKELEMEVETDIPSLVQNNYYQLNDEQLDQLIEQKLKQIRAGVTLSGEGKKDKGKSA
jgi:L-rhamnose isomerase